MEIRNTVRGGITAFAVVVLGTLSTAAGPAVAHGWRVEVDFEDGTEGANAEGPDAFNAARSGTFYDRAQAHGGSQSAISTIEAATTGPGWGGSWRFPGAVREGGEVWYRVWVYYPDGFDFSCGCSEGIKFMRLWTQPGGTTDGSTEGSWDYYLSTSGAVMATGVNGPEFYGNHPWPHEDIRGLGGPIETGSWHAYEHYVKLSSVSGEAIIRAWRDGVLIFEDTESATLTTDNSEVYGSSIWGYWNNTAPRTQSAWVDDVVITNEAPGAVDAFGNAYIGIGEAPPAPGDGGIADAGTSLPDASVDSGTGDGGLDPEDAGGEADSEVGGGDAGASPPEAMGGCSAGGQGSPKGLLFTCMIAMAAVFRRSRRST